MINPRKPPNHTLTTDLQEVTARFYYISYWAKWAASYTALQLQKQTHRRRFDLYDFETNNEPEKVGVIVPEEETVLESPFPEEHLDEAADEIFIYGVNSKSECVVLRITRVCDEKAEAWIYLKVADGRRYQLQETSGYQRSFGDKCTMFSCGGLQMYFMSPMRRWRIVYCGMLREVRQDGKENDAVFVKFSFLWTASSEVYDFTSDFEIQPTAEAMANAQWTSFLPPIDRVTEAFNFYSQSGVITGIVSVEDQPDTEMYLFGERIRHIGKHSSVVGCKFKQVLGFVLESGLVVHLGRASVPNTFHNLPFGFIVHPNGTLHAIQDGLIITRMSENEDPGKNLTAMFKAGKQYELTGDFEENCIISEENSQGYLELHEIEFEVDSLKGRGILISGEVMNLPERKPQRIAALFPSVKPLTVNFTDEICHFTELTGGKGSSLGKLTKLSNELHSFIVPKGIVVTTAAYSEFLTAEITQKIENLKDVTYGNIRGNIQDACQIVASAIKRSHLPDKITRKIEETLNALFDGKINQCKFAVRSSATGEDTDQMSAAGQMDTFLGVQGLEEICIAVKKCWASQFGYIAVEYKRQNGQILNSPMAVVIQKMVDCESAGVLFTCDPVTNNPSVLVITGNYGLGESVVSGSEEPDTVVLERLQEGEVEMKSVTIGLKQHKIIVSGTKTFDEENTVTEDVPEDKRNECCIAKEMAEQLGRISLKIEDYFKSPRDIEWGIVYDTIYIFQSRPVTTGASLSDYEIKHEFDGPLRCEGEYFSICNVGEVLPGATSPLGMDIILKFIGMVFYKKEVMKKERGNFHQNKYFPAGMIPICNHTFLTVVDLICRMGNTESLEGQSIQIAIFGRLLDDPGIKVLAKFKEYPPLKKSLWSIFNSYKNLFFSGYGIEEMKKKAFSYEFPSEKCRTSIQVFNELIHSCSNHSEAFAKHYLCSQMSSYWNMNIFIILGKAKGGIDNEVYNDFSKLLSSSSSVDNDVESADVPSAMQDLAHWIVKEMKSEDFKAMSIEAAKEWLETSTGVAGCKFRHFIKRHGHRCLKELDVYSLPWGEDKNALIKLLQNMSGSCTDVKEKKKAEFSTLLAELNVPLNFKSRMMLRYVLPNSHRCVREREICKSIVVKHWDNTRKGFQCLSQKMVSEGYMPDKELIYFMTIDEIKDLLHNRNPRLIARANQRRKLFPSLQKIRFAELMKGRPTPINEEKDEKEYVADFTMKGIPVSQGSVKGYARVAKSLEEASYLQPGEILITYSTDIGWSPYFPILAGVVTELGGLISHGAVVSREYGLPCVVGLSGATRKFVTGDYVLLDGNKGILQRLTAPDGQ